MLGKNSSNSLEYVNKKWNDAFFFLFADTLPEQTKTKNEWRGIK